MRRSGGSKLCAPLTGEWVIDGGATRLYPRPPTHPPTHFGGHYRESQRISCVTHAHKKPKLVVRQRRWLSLCPGDIKLLREKTIVYVTWRLCRRAAENSSTLFLLLVLDLTHPFPLAVEQSWSIFCSRGENRRRHFTAARTSSSSGRAGEPFSSSFHNVWVSVSPTNYFLKTRRKSRKLPRAVGHAPSCGATCLSACHTILGNPFCCLAARSPGCLVTSARLISSQ